MSYAIALRYTQKGELKSRIIEHMLSCNSNEAETVSHISKALDALQPDVFRSTKALVAGGILEKTEISSNKKELRLTDKGAAIAVLAGIESEKLEEYYSNTKPKDYKSESDRERHKLFEVIRQQTEDTTKQKTILKRALQYMLDHGWYDQENKVLNFQERLNLVLSMAPLVQSETLDLKGYIELTDKFGVPNDIIGTLALTGFDDSLNFLTRCGLYLDMSRVIATRPGIKPFLEKITILLDDIIKAVDVRISRMTDKMYLESMGLAAGKNEAEIRKLLIDDIKDTKESFDLIRKVVSKVNIPEDTLNTINGVTAEVSATQPFKQSVGMDERSEPATDKTSLNESKSHHSH